jgi:hypothetical protein
MADCLDMPDVDPPLPAARPAVLTRRDGVLATLLGLAFFVLYLVTLCPTVYWYDSAELVTASVVLGIPHPPGYPLYTLIGHVFTWLPVDPALAVNAMSAVFGAISVGLVFAIARSLGARPAAAVVAGGLLGAGSLFWAQAVVAEVYAPGLAFALAVWLMLLRGVAVSRAHWLFAAAFVAGLGLGVHLSIATLGLGFAALVLGFDAPPIRNQKAPRVAGSRGLASRLRIGLGASLAAAAGASIYLYLPWRAAQQPLLNFGDPSSLERFMWMITGGNYKHWFLEGEPFGERALHFAGSFAEQLLGIGLLLAFAGLAWLVRTRKWDATVIALMIAGNVYWFFWYAVHDVEVFLLPTTAILCVLAGLGVEGAVELTERREAGRDMPRLHRLPHLPRLVEGVFCALPLAMVAGNFAAADMSEERGAADFVRKVVAGLPEGAIIVNYTTPPEWKLDAVFGMYVQKVLGERQDVRVVTRPEPELVAELVLRGHAVFAYFPVDGLRDNFALDFDGPLVAVGAPDRDVVMRLEALREERRRMTAVGR